MLKRSVAIGMSILLSGAAGSVPRMQHGATEAASPHVPEIPAASTKAHLETDVLNAPCTNTDADRRSALCAQWVAADAAKESALLAIGSFLTGLLALIAAVVAAVYAARSMKTAREALDHERSLKLPRFMVTAKIHIYSGSDNGMSLSLDGVGENPVRNLAFESLTYEGGALGEREVLQKSRDGSESDDGRHLTLKFGAPKAFAAFPKFDAVNGLIDQPVRFTASWTCNDVTGGFRRQKVELEGEFLGKPGTLARTAEAWVEMSASTFDELS